MTLNVSFTFISVYIIEYYIKQDEYIMTQMHALQNIASKISKVPKNILEIVNCKVDHGIDHKYLDVT